MKAHRLAEALAKSGNLLDEARAGETWAFGRRGLMFRTRRTRR